MLRASRCLPSSLVALSLAGCAFVSNTRLEAQLDKDGDGVMVSLDCDDRDPSVGNTLLYRDADGDGFGQGLPERRCGAAEGWAATGGDCDDLRDTVHPDADERCNSIDDNCDGDIDGEDAVDPLSWYADLDADGFGQPSEEPLGVACDAPSALTADNALDCDDSNAAVGDRRAFFEDQDGDGFGNADVAVAACEPPAGFVEQVFNLGMPNQGYDCDDTNAAINPGAPEICDAADTDENCNGLTDDDDPAFDPTMVRGLWFADRDGDGFGSTAETVRSCDLPPSEPHAFGDETHAAHAWTVDSRDCEDDPEDEAAVDLEAPQNCDIEQIAVGVDTGCYREANGFVGCIGDNSSIVDGVPEISFVSIDVGREHACGVTVEGELACWGEGPAEEGGPLHEAAPAANAVSLQLNHTCILTPQGTLECWAEDISYSVVSGDEAGNGYVQVSRVPGTAVPSSGPAREVLPVPWTALAEGAPPTASARMLAVCSCRWEPGTASLAACSPTEAVPTLGPSTAGGPRQPPGACSTVPPASPSARGRVRHQPRGSGGVCGRRRPRAPRAAPRDQLRGSRRRGELRLRHLWRQRLRLLGPRFQPVQRPRVDSSRRHAGWNRVRQPQRGYQTSTAVVPRPRARPPEPTAVQASPLVVRARLRISAGVVEASKRCRVNRDAV